MCARYVVEYPSQVAEHLAEALGVVMPPVKARHNVAPTQVVPVVPNLFPLHVEQFRWGLVPRWAKDLKIGHKTINARVETLAEKPSFREALKRRRCLVLADGFYEWLDEGGRKQPLLFRRKGGGPFAFAGLWDEWRSPEGEILQTFTIVTTASNELIRPFHDRMPVILSPAAYRNWLEEGELRPDDALRVLAPGASGGSGVELEFTRVSTAANDPRVDTPECVRPVAPKSPGTLPWR
jgi:putative SOS response-associated peptidase YedK